MYIWRNAPLILTLACRAKVLTGHPHTLVPNHYELNSTATPSYTYDELWKLQTKFYDNFLYPANVRQARSINSTLFTDDVIGRVSQTRNFIGRELNTEYLFGLFIPTEGASVVGQPISYEIIQFVANQNIASASTRVVFNFTNFGTQLPVQLNTWITWNSVGQISQYDADFRWFGYLLQTLVRATEPISHTTSDAAALAFVAAQLANSTCNTHQTYCNGTNQQYADYGHCINFLLNDIRIGQDWELGANTLLCRSLHEIMVRFRPSVHCPHIGKSGGGYCVDDQTYVEKLTANPFTISPFVAYDYNR